MEIRTRNVVSCLLRRPWLSLPFGVWVVISVLYYWWLISHISFLESQNRVIRYQLAHNSYQVPEIADETGTLCETIHISFVCMGKCGRQIMPMMKSLLHHRQNPLYLHLIVDGNTQKSISKLFDTWDLPDFKYKCYNAQKLLWKVEWIPNNHYSGIYAFVKLLYPDILPKTVTKVIALDSDLTFLSDVAELWDMFRNMTKHQFIGIVENESNWYFELNRWPALGRGFNTGVMLLNLQRMRSETNWSKLWLQVVDENIERLQKTSLADQDIINAVIKKYPYIVYNVSCMYNIQMSTRNLAKECYGEDVKKVKIIHWNSPTRYSVAVPDADFFRNIHYSYVSYDGNLLKEKLHKCWQRETVTYPMNHSDVCISFRAAQKIKLRTHIYYMDYSYESQDNFDITLVLQLSIDRLQFLERLVKHWDGPLSAAIYLADCDVNKFESYIQEASTLSSRKNIGYHLVYKKDLVHYPVNYLRNVALENVKTPYVFLMDVDFVPMANLYHHLRVAIRVINPYPQKKCLVVPAFETQRYRATPPHNKRALRARLAPRAGLRPPRAQPDVAPFRAHEWPRGHRATNYTRWLDADKPYEVEWEPDYEPYLVVHRSVPKYDTRFSGFGWNKVSHIVELRAQGYRAVVLPDAFVVHTTHAPSADIVAFRADPHYRICLAILKQEFLDDLKRKHNITFEDRKPDSVYSAQAKSLLLNQAKDTS